MGRDQSADERDRITRLIRWLETPPEERAGLLPLAHEAREVRELFLEEVARRLALPVNDRLKSLPSATVGEKSALCAMLNSFLASLDLGVRCPITGRTGILTADPSDDPAAGRFRIKITDSSGHDRRTTAFVKLRPLQFAPRVDHDLRRPWTDLLEAGSSSRPRSR